MNKKKQEETQQEEKQLVDANGQIHIFSPSEGLPEDFEDERRVRARTARAEAEFRKARIDAVKKRVVMRAKIRDREAHYYQVLDVIDEARLASLKYPDEVFLAVDFENDPVVMTLKDWKKFGFQKNDAASAMYAIWMNEQQKTWGEVKDLVDADPVEDEVDSDEDEDEYEDDEGIEALAELAKERLGDRTGKEEGAA
jgi:hypothetical protein